MDIPHSEPVKDVKETLKALKAKLLRILYILLLIGIPAPTALAFRRYLVGGPLYLPVVNTVLFVIVVIGLFSSRYFNLTVRSAAFIAVLFGLSVNGLFSGDITGSGYLGYIVVFFCSQYFFSRKTTAIISVFAIVMAAAIAGLRISGVIAVPETQIGESYMIISLTKLFAVAGIAVMFNQVGYRQIDVLINALKESALSQHELRREKSTTEHYLDSIPGLFVLYNEAWEVERWNKNVVTQLGYDEKELYRKKIFTFFDDESKPAVQQGLLGVAVKGESYTEGFVVKYDGSKLPVALHSKKLNYGDHTLVSVMATDLSEKRQLEKEVQEAQKMEALGTLAGGVAHDLNNVLAGITGYADIMRYTMVKGEVPKLQFVENILTSCDRAAGIVKQILMFSRRSEIKKIPIQLRSIVRDAVKLIRHTIPKSIEIVEDISREDHPVLADVNQIHQVVMNICTNAWHAMRENGGTMSVSLGVVDVGKPDIPDKYDAAPGLYQKISVKDTGSGIPPEVMDKIFMPFFTTKPEGQGTGLGLAVVEKILRSHDGFLTVDTIVNKGTIFSIYMPIANQLELMNNADLDEELPGGTELILVIDDEPQVRDASTIMLEKLGYTVLTAEDGVQGLDVYKQNRDRIRLLITDLAMPRMDGVKLATTIKKENPAMPILLCTGYSEAMDLEEIKTEHFTALMHKPLRMDKLAVVARNLIDGKPLDPGLFSM